MFQFSFSILEFKDGASVNTLANRSKSLENTDLICDDKVISDLVKKERQNSSCGNLDNLDLTSKELKYQLDAKARDEKQEKESSNKLKCKLKAENEKENHLDSIIKCNSFKLKLQHNAREPIIAKKQAKQKNLIKSKGMSTSISMPYSMKGDLCTLHLNVIENEFKQKLADDEDKKRRQSTGEILRIQNRLSTNQSDLTKSLNESLFSDKTVNGQSGNTTNSFSTQ